MMDQVAEAWEAARRERPSAREQTRRRDAEKADGNMMVLTERETWIRVRGTIAAGTDATHILYLTTEWMGKQVKCVNCASNFVFGRGGEGAGGVGTGETGRVFS